MDFFYPETKVSVHMDVHAIEILRNTMKHVLGPTTIRGCRSIHMIAATGQVGLKYITNSIVGVLRERIVLLLRCFRCPPLTGNIGFIVNFKIGHIVMIAHVKPVHGCKDMFPPFIPIGGGSWRIGRPGGMVLVIPAS